MDDDIEWIREEPEKPSTTSYVPPVVEAPKPVEEEKKEAPPLISNDSVEIVHPPVENKNDDVIAWIRDKPTNRDTNIEPSTTTYVPPVVDAPKPVEEEKKQAPPPLNGSVEIVHPPPKVVVAGPEENKNDDVIAWIRDEPINRDTNIEDPLTVPDSRIESEVSSVFDISECERRLNEATQETKELVHQLCDKSSQLKDNNDRISQDLAAQRAMLNETNGVHKTIEDIAQVPVVAELPSTGLPRNVESVIIGDGLLQAISGCSVLPNGRILVTDVEQGILLYDIGGDCIKKISNPEWRNPRSPVCHKDHVMILMDVHSSETGENIRHIFKFTVNLEFVAKIEGPMWLLNRTVLYDRISLAHTDYLYLSACGQISSALFELSPVGQWTELEFRQSESYIDMVAFATIGPITQLLVVEGRKNYCLQLSVRESEIVDRRRIAICERPGALARDDAGRLFVADRSSASVQLVDTVRWVSSKAVAVTESVVAHFSACWGLLAIPLKGNIRVQKYSFR